MSERILLLEDDDDLATITDAVVSSAGYDVVRASSVNDAIAQCESVPPDVALVDVQLPERSGWDFVREATRWPEMRIVVYTVHHDEPETIEQFDMTTFVANPDEERVLAIRPDLKTAILSNGVDTYADYGVGARGSFERLFLARWV